MVGTAPRAFAHPTNLRRHLLPDRQISSALFRFIRINVNPLHQKYSASAFRKIMIVSARPRPARGTYRDRHGRWARDAMDVVVRKTSVASTDGEIAWS